jgi:hypothetical protein
MASSISYHLCRRNRPKKNGRQFFCAAAHGAFHKAASEVVDRSISLCVKKIFLILSLIPTLQCSRLLCSVPEHRRSNFFKNNFSCFNAPGINNFLFHQKCPPLKFVNDKAASEFGFKPLDFGGHDQTVSATAVRSVNDTGVIRRNRFLAPRRLRFLGARRIP